MSQRKKLPGRVDLWLVSAGIWAKLMRNSPMNERYREKLMEDTHQKPGRLDKRCVLSAWCFSTLTLTLNQWSMAHRKWTTWRLGFFSASSLWTLEHVTPLYSAIICQRPVIPGLPLTVCQVKDVQALFQMFMICLKRVLG